MERAVSKGGERSYNGCRRYFEAFGGRGYADIGQRATIVVIKRGILSLHRLGMTCISGAADANASIPTRGPMDK